MCTCTYLIIYHNYRLVISVCMSVCVFMCVCLSAWLSVLYVCLLFSSNSRPFAMNHEVYNQEYSNILDEFHISLENILI